MNAVRYIQDGMPSDRPDESLLNANHRRHYEVVFARLEDALSQLAEPTVPFSDREPHALTIIHDDLPRGFAVAAAPLVDRARRLIRDAAAHWGLLPRKISRRRVVRASLTAQLIQLEESSASGLRGYGAVREGAAGEIDPVIAELHMIVAELRGLIDNDES
jgi:hypothetical protein